MSRSAFAREKGATCKNDRYAWSYVNEAEQFVIFGAWKEEILQGRQRVFSTSWEFNSEGRRSNAYAESLRNIELIVEEGYRLFTFPQWREPDKQGILKIKGFEKELTEQVLEISDGDYFAMSPTARNKTSDFDAPDVFFEGDRTDTIQTVYERNPEARKKCIEKFGAKCQVCLLDFGEKYGELAKGYIHVHHIVPVSSRGSKYKVNPIRDLVPVCPNCHAVIHKRRPEPFSIEEVQAMIEASK